MSGAEDEPTLKRSFLRQSGLENKIVRGRRPCPQNPLVGLSYIEPTSVKRDQTSIDSDKFNMKSTEDLILEADFGSTEAQLRLAAFFIDDETFDFDCAEKWLRQLIQKGSIYAKYELYHLYNTGRKIDGTNYQTDENLAISRNLLTDAAKEGHAQALYDLALIEMQNKESYMAGLNRMISSAEQGHTHANTLLKKYEQKLPLTLVMAANGDLANEESDHASTESRDFQLSIELGNLGVATRQAMAGDYLNRRQLYEEAFAWYEKAAQRGNSDAAFNLAVLHMEHSVPQADSNIALRLLEPLANTGDSDALHLKAKIYLQKKMYAHAIAHFRLSADTATDSKTKDEESEYAMAFTKKYGDPEVIREANEIYQYCSGRLKSK